MPKPRTNWSIDEKRGVVVGWFHELRGPGQTWTPRLDLCPVEEYLFKSTTSGSKKRRTAVEQKRFIDQQRSEKLKLALEERKADPKRNRSGPKMRAVIQQWLDQVAATCSKETVSTYARSASLYIKLVNNHRLSDLDQSKLVKFSSGLLDQQVSAASRHKHATHLQIFINWAFDQGLIERQLKIKKPRVTKKEFRTLSAEAVIQVQNYLEERIGLAQNEQQRISRVNRLRAWVLIRYTAMRGGEVRSLLLDQIDLKRGVLSIQDNLEARFEVKGRKERTIPVVEPLAEFLQSDFKSRNPSERYYLDNSSGQPYFAHLNNLTVGIRKALAACGIEGVKPLHGLRGTVLTELSALGVDALVLQKIAGHADLSTTRGYVNADQLDMRKALATLPNRG